MGYVAARIEELKSHLASLPPVDPTTREITKLEAIRRLTSEIAALQKKGYRIDEVAQFITERGVAITGATLKQYLYRLRTKRARRRPEQLGETSPLSARVPTGAHPQKRLEEVEASTLTPPGTTRRPEEAGPATTTSIAKKRAVNADVDEVASTRAPSYVANPGQQAAPATPRGTIPPTNATARLEPLDTIGTGSFKPREDSDDL
jgi:hypothetical protein